MLLQSLVNYYYDLAEQEKVFPRGWEHVNISYVLDLDENGRLKEVASVKQQQTTGKKSFMRPTAMLLPTAVLRSNGVHPNFLWDKSSYILGVDDKGKPTRTAECFSASKAWHKKLLDGVDTPAARALLLFFDSWNPAQICEYPFLMEHLDEISSTAYLTFRVDGMYVADDELIQAAWNAYKNADATDPSNECMSLVTGHRGKVIRVHPQFKGIVGAQSSGASLVSFNMSSALSHGWKQGMNARISEFDAYAYSTALNSLIKDREHVYRIGDATILCWAQGGEPAYQDLFLRLVSASEEDEPERVLEILCDLSNGDAIKYEGVTINPDTTFYVLALAPNAARLSVKLFYHNSFGRMMGNILTYYQDVEIDGNFGALLHPWQLLYELINPKSKKSTTLLTSVTFLEAFLTGGPYPSTLWSSLFNRIIIEHNVSWRKAAITKAYFLRVPYIESIEKEEVFGVALNPESNNVPYTLGRLCSVLFSIEETADPNLKDVVQARAFKGLLTTPATSFPMVIQRAYGKLRTLGRLQETFDEQLMDLFSRLDEQFPEVLTEKEQGEFIIGYYHQMTARYKKKGEEE